MEPLTVAHPGRSHVLGRGRMSRGGSVTNRVPTPFASRGQQGLVRNLDAPAPLPDEQGPGSSGVRVIHRDAWGHLPGHDALTADKIQMSTGAMPISWIRKTTPEPSLSSSPQ